MGEFLVSKTQSKTIRRGENFEGDERRKTQIIAPEMELPKQQAKFKSLPEQIAESDIYMKHYKFDGAEKAFPYDPRARTVEWFFPYAKVGPLMIDVPDDQNEINVCLEKDAVFKKTGLSSKIKYLIIKPGMQFNDAMQILHGVQ